MKKLWAYNIGLYEKQYNDHSRDKILMKKIKLTKKQKQELNSIAKYFLEATEPIEDSDLKAMVTAKILSRIGALSDRLVSKMENKVKCPKCGKRMVTICWECDKRFFPLMKNTKVETELRLKLQVADYVMMTIDEQVKMGTLDSRSVISDARLSYGEPFKYEFKKVLENKK